jgi:hypothetical protein
MTGLLRHRWRALILAAAGPLLPVGAAAHPYLQDGWLWRDGRWTQLGPA